MTTVFLDVVFKPFFKIVHDTGQQLTIDRTNFLTDGFLRIIQRTGFVSVNTRFQIPPKEKNHTLKDRENEGPTARLRNGKWGARETCFEQWSVTRLQCALWHHLVESGQPRGKECRPPRQPSRPTYWVLPIQKMSGSRGSPCIYDHLPGWLFRALPDNFGLLLISLNFQDEFDTVASTLIQYTTWYVSANLAWDGGVCRSAVTSRSCDSILYNFREESEVDICNWPLCSQWHEARIQKVWIGALLERGWRYGKQMFVSCLQRGYA